VLVPPNNERQFKCFKTQYFFYQYLSFPFPSSTYVSIQTNICGLVVGLKTLAKQPDPIDVHVGIRVRLRRTLLGFSQEKLGTEVGLTFQQIQKYERGANRISASRLYQFSVFLGVPVSFFFDDMPESITGKKTLRHGDDYDQPILFARETLTLVRAYYGIADVAKRKSIYNLTMSIAESDRGKSKS